MPLRPPLQTARDYNRRRPASASIRPAGAEGRTLPRLAASLFCPGRRLWTVPLLLAPVLVGILFPLDQWVADLVARQEIGGDVRRELEAWQQYGAIGSFLFTAMIVWRLDPAQKWRLLDLLVAIALVGITITLLKILVGRARPGFAAEAGALGLFVPLWSQYPVHGTVPVYNWEAGARLWSMPSSHTAYAVVLSVFLATLYPRLKWIGVGMVLLVGVCRVLFRAHYPSDVVIGACVAMAIAAPAITRRWGILARNMVWDFLVLPLGARVAGLLPRAGISTAREGPRPADADGRARDDGRQAVASR